MFFFLKKILNFEIGIANVVSNFKSSIAKVVFTIKNGIPNADFTNTLDWEQKIEMVLFKDERFIATLKEEKIPEYATTYI